MVVVYLFWIAFGAAMAIWPERFAKPSANTSRKRLAEFAAGASEHYFEEQRALTEYKPTSRFLLLWRIIGALMVLTAIGSITDRTRETEERVATTEIYASMSVARDAFARAEKGDAGAYREAQSALARSEAALDDLERIRAD